MKDSDRIQSENSFTEYGITQKEEQLLSAIEQGTAEDLGTSVTPEAAENKLMGLGYAHSTWENIVLEKIGSHETRTLALVALGHRTRIKTILHANLRALDYLEKWPLLSPVVGIELVMQDETMQTEALRRAKTKISK